MTSIDFQLIFIDFELIFEKFSIGSQLVNENQNQCWQINGCMAEEIAEENFGCPDSAYGEGHCQCHQ